MAEQELQEPNFGERFYRSDDWLFYVLWLRSQGRDEEALQVCVEARNVASTPQTLFALGVSLKRNKLEVEAIDVFRDCVRQYPLWPSAYFNLGISLVEREMYNEAISILLKYLELSPDGSSAYIYIGLAYRSQNDWTSAIQAYRDGIGIYATPELLVELGNALRETGDVNESLKYLRDVTVLYPNYSAGHLGLAKTLYAAHNIDEAKREFECVIKVEDEFEEEFGSDRYDVEKDRTIKMEAVDALRQIG